MTRFAQENPTVPVAAPMTAAPWFGGLAMRLRRWWSPAVAVVRPNPVPSLARSDLLDSLCATLDQARAGGQALVALLIGASGRVGADDPHHLRIRLRAALRSGDLVAAGADGRFLVLSCLDNPGWGEGYDAAALRLAHRLQAAFSHGTARPTHAIAAIALSAGHDLSGEAIYDTLATALNEAELTGPGTILLLAAGGITGANARRSARIDTPLSRSAPAGQGRSRGTRHPRRKGQPHTTLTNPAAPSRAGFDGALTACSRDSA